MKNILLALICFTANVFGNCSGLGTATITFHPKTENYRLASRLGFPFYRLLNVHHIGPGRTTVTVNNYYAGLTTIEQGIWAAGGVDVFSPNSAYLIQSSGEMNLEHFDQQISNLINNGVVDFGAPGTTLSVVHNFTQKETGTLIHKVSMAGDTDLLIVGKTACLGGTLLVDSVDAYSLTRTYPILHANQAVIGKFKCVAAGPLVKPVVTIGERDVWLSFQPNLVAAAHTHNQAVVAQRLDALNNPSTDQLTLLQSLVNLTPGAAEKTLQELSGEPYAYLAQVDRHASEGFNRRIYNALRYTLCSCCNPWTGWFQIEGGQSFTPKHMRAANVDFSLGGFKKTGNFLFGAGANYRTHHIHFDHHGKSHWNTAQGAIYGTYCNQWGYIFVDAMGGQSWGDLKRTIGSHSRPKVTDGLLYAELALNLRLATWLLQPFIAGEAGFFSQQRSVEFGPHPLFLTQHPQTTTIYDTYLGTHVMTCFATLMFSLDLAWQHRFGHSHVCATNAFQFGSPFEINSPRFGKDGFKGALNVKRELSNGIAIYGQLFGEGWERWASYGIDIGINVYW